MSINLSPTEYTLMPVVLDDGTMIFAAVDKKQQQVLKSLSFKNPKKSLPAITITDVITGETFKLSTDALLVGLKLLRYRLLSRLAKQQYPFPIHYTNAVLKNGLIIWIATIEDDPIGDHQTPWINDILTGEILPLCTNGDIVVKKLQGVYLRNANDNTEKTLERVQ